MNELQNEAFLKKLREGKVVQFAPMGISMTPFIRGGQDKVLVRKEETVGVGDIVLVVYRNNLILHRVYVINGSRLTLMGDGNLQGIEEVGMSEVNAGSWAPSPAASSTASPVMCAFSVSPTYTTAV